MKISSKKAVDLLKSENIVAVPTETVYGLAARYDSEKAIRSIFDTKNRPLDHPLIVHIATINWLYHLADEIKPYVSQLIEKFWPGPLTVVLKKKRCVSNLITGNQDTVAIRMPDHPLLIEVIKKLGVPIVAPSANSFCKTSPTSAEHVENNFLSKIPVLDGGPCKVGIESTIVLATDKDTLTILRPGIISIQEIQNTIKMPCHKNDLSGVKSPGKKNVHYQPSVPILAFEKISELHFQSIKKINRKYFVMCFYNHMDLGESHHVIKMPNNPLFYSQILYEKWYSVSDADFDNIIIELPPNEDQWHGIRDRILKAASGQLEEIIC
ncbi:MAG: L-threonylcarbamoyladenylate synthase [Gammaproteobacteria bacterium]|nr:L-threonylcarbamoyladenylate synthase [Gammaproteobacteria bacterium]